MKVPVRPYCRVVASGRVGSMLKLTLIATPEYVGGGDATEAFEFDAWPGEMAKLVRAGFKIRVREAAAGKLFNDDDPLAGWHEVTAHARRLGEINLGRGHPMDASWRGSNLPWEGLAHDIMASLQGKKHEPQLQAYAPPALAEVQDQFDRDGALRVAPPAPDSGVAIQGVVSLAQADLAAETESVRAARVLAKAMRGPYVFDDETPRPDPNAAPLDPDTFAQDEQAAHFKNFIDTVAATTDARTMSQDHFHDVLHALTNGGPAATGLARSAPATQPIVPASKTMTQGGCPKLRASHDYGTWLQRSKTLSWQGKDPPLVPTDDEAAKTFQATIADARSTFYAYQGDPVLARLFCLAIDLEIDVASLPAPIAETRRLLLACPPPPRSALHLVVTAAKLEPHGFWPMSVFDQGVVRGQGDTYAVLEVPDMVEQSAGVWRLGERMSRSDGSSTPRYELVGLDMRRATDAKFDRIDRGERHATAGLSLVDRGRALQIARDLALTRLHLDSAEVAGIRPAILYAEELTISRRVDVAAIPAGADPKQVTPRWRSLMHQILSIDFGIGNGSADQTALLEALLRPQLTPHGILQETSFQASARYMPLLVAPPAKDAQGGTAPKSPTMVPCDAVAEEAVFLWDGTPAGALTDSRAGRGAGDRGYPFGRHFDLPSISNDLGRLRPPPLRYGVPYVLRLRSVFLGGVSPSVEEANVSHGDDSCYLVPSQPDTKVAPRRFLRHEAIAAPTLLFPKHVAFAQDKVMQYEALAEAIVRTAIPAQKADPSQSDRYIPAVQRAVPMSTMRVFLPPTASREIVVRHGKLDGADPARVLRGGLRDIEFHPRRQGSTIGGVSVGFPAAIDRKLPALGDQGAIFERSWVVPGQDSEPGIPVFVPQGVNTSTPNTAYLPDPSIRHYCIRARRRESDLYLDGQILAELYDDGGSSYPDILPLVVELRRIAATRTHPLRSLGEMVTQNRLGRMLQDGRVTNAAPKQGGTHVRHVVLSLARGEDFDLEVACLPSAETLAATFTLPETIALQLDVAVTDATARQRLSAVCGKLPEPVVYPEGAPSTGVAGLPASNGVKAAAQLLIDTMQARWRLEEVAAVTRLRVCHAVNRPDLDPPLGIASIQVYRPGPSIAEGSFGVRPASQPASKTVLLDGTLDLDLAKVSGFEVLARVVRPNGGAFDDPVRSRSLIARRAGRWPHSTGADGKRNSVPTRDVVGFDVAPDGRVTLPFDTVRLLRVENLPTDGAAFGGIIEPGEKDKLITPDPIFLSADGRLTRLALAPLHAAAINGATLRQVVAAAPDAYAAKPRRRAITTEQPQPLTDTKARRLQLCVVALSRHSAAFETPPAYVKGAEHLLQRRTPLSHYEQSQPGKWVPVCVPATERPASPTPLRPEPSFVFTRTVEPLAGGKKYVVNRRALARLLFKRGWFSSGEGERLGIVLWPPNYFDRDQGAYLALDRVEVNGRKMSISDLQDGDLGTPGAFITRWGGDPIRRDAKPQQIMLIPPDAFACPCGDLPHGPLRVNSVPMPYPSSKRDELDLPNEDEVDAGSAAVTDYLPVSLLTYEPCFDLDREQWYVDVDLQPTRPSEPFVRFGLVRYQEQSIDPKLMVSRPVVVTTQLLPERTMEVCVTGAGDRTVTVTVNGFGSLGIKDLPGAGDALAPLRYPLGRLHVMHEAQGSDGSLLRIPLERVDALPQGRQLAVSDAGELRWTTCVTVSKLRMQQLGPGSYVAYFEELDQRMPATYKNEPIKPADVWDPGTFVVSGPRFSARVPFLEFELPSLPLPSVPIPS